MKLIISFLFVFSAAANYVTPEVSRDGKTLTDNALSVIWQERKGVGLELSSIDYERTLDGTQDRDEKSKSINPYGFYSGKQASIEGSIFKLSSDYEYNENSSSSDVEVDTIEIDLKAGWRIDKNIGVAVSIANIKDDVKQSSVSYEDKYSSREFALSYKLDKYIFGGGYRNRETEVDGSEKLSYNELYLGFGIVDYFFEKQEGYSVELLLERQSAKKEEGSKTTSEVGDMTKVLVGVTYAKDFYEFDFQYSVDDGDRNEDGSIGRKVKILKLDIEFTFLKSFYITPGYYDYSSELDYKTISNINDDRERISLTSGYRTAKWDASIEYQKYDRERAGGSTTSDDYKKEGKVISANIAFFL